MKDRIASLLGSGLAPQLVATATGCSPSYISQLLQDETFVADVATLRVKDIETLQKRDGKWDGLEDNLLLQLEKLVPHMFKPRDVLSALQVVNSAKRRAAELTKGSNINQQINIHNTVVLELPQKTIASYELSKTNEVISVEGKTLAPMPTTVLMNELKTFQASKTRPEEIQNDDRPKDLPVLSRDNLSPETRERIVSAELV